MIEWKEVSVYTGRNVVEDAPVNSVAGGGVDMNVTGGRKKKKEVISREGVKVDARTKAYKEHRARLEALRQKREARKNDSKSKFIENIKNKTLTREYAYDTDDPVADLNAQKSSSGYELYHKQFSGAMQHAYKVAKSKGYTVDPKEIDDKVASGPKKPSSGKTNKYILGTNKNKKVHIQVANLDNKRYELNMYID